MRSPIPADLVNAPVWPGPLKDKEPYKVLVADDDPVCLKMVAQMLKQCNYLGAKPPQLACCLDLAYWTQAQGGWTWQPYRSIANTLRLTVLGQTAVSTCTNGKDALLMLRDPAICYDLVLSDVYMPGAACR